MGWRSGETHPAATNAGGVYKTMALFYSMSMQSPIIRMKEPITKGHAPLSVLYSHQGCRCFYCNKYIAYAAHTKKDNGHSIDHLFPRSRGFGRGGNSVLACRKCNEKKGDRWPTVKEICKAWELYARMGRPFIAEIILP